SGSGSSVGVNLVQPVIGARPYVDDEEQAYEEDEEIHRSRRPVRARSRGHPVIAASGHRHRGRDRGDHFDSYRKLTAEPDEVRGRRSARVHRRESDDDDEDDEGEEFVATRTHRISHAREGFMFFPKCSSRMFPVQGKLHCNSCGYERSFSGKDATTAKVARSGKEKPSETLVLDEITETLPKTRVECPKCGHYEAFWVMR